jgi:hypothetical protein
MGRFLILYRYALLACIVLAFGAYVIDLICNPPPASFWKFTAVQSLPLHERYREVRPGMTAAKIRKILGPPQDVFDPGHDVYIRWTWREGGYCVQIRFLPIGDNPAIIKVLMVDEMVIDYLGLLQRSPNR